MIEFDDDIPLPERLDNRKETLLRMKPGQSFMFRSNYKAWTNAASCYGRLLGWQFTVRKVRKDGVWRLWRVT